MNNEFSNNSGLESTGTSDEKSQLISSNLSDNIVPFKTQKNGDNLAVDQNVAYVIDTTLNKNNNKSNFDYAGAAGGFLDKYGYPYCNGRIYNKVEVDNNQYDNKEEIFWACGACIFVRNIVFKKSLQSPALQAGWSFFAALGCFL